mmetsp:Transcript_53530/g.59795  ORF Transcript_53530/g.59795 Transcript_53530/m.59795 type:complete len:203 (-) Transcript_53530:248-856(-)
MIPQEKEHPQTVVIGRLYNRIPHYIFIENVTTTDNNMYTTQHQIPPPPLLPSGFNSDNCSNRKRRQVRERKKFSHPTQVRYEGDDLFEIVKDTETAPKLSKRSKAKAKKALLLFQEQHQRRHDEQLKELRQQAVAAINTASIREYYEKRSSGMVTQTQNALDIMGIDEYSNIPYYDIENENEKNYQYNCFLRHILPFFQRDD